MSTIDKIHAAKQAFEAAKVAMKENGKEACIEAVKPIFDEFPLLHSITAKAWVPGFNDGDACSYTFSADDCDMEFIQGEDDTFKYEAYGDELPEGVTKEQIESIQDKFSTVCYTVIGEDVFEITFGPDQEIKFLSDGTIEVDYYDCGY